MLVPSWIPRTSLILQNRIAIATPARRVRVCVDAGGYRLANYSGVKLASISRSMSYMLDLQFFPIAILKILPVVLVIGWGLVVLAGRHTSNASVEASTTRNPVVAPAGTVLRVRLNQTLETGQSRPGDRFGGVLDAPVMVGTTEILPKGTRVEGHVEPLSRTAAAPHAVLALTLDCFERGGEWLAVSTKPVAWTGSPERGRTKLQDMDLHVGAEAANGGAASAISVPADSIVGFTLKRTLTA